MPVVLHSFAKINIGLKIGLRRDDGFHELRTVYQTVALHDRIRIELARGTGIEIRSKHPDVPTDETNTAYRAAERVLRALKLRSKIIIHLEKNLPVRGGLGAASGNAVAAMLGVQRALKRQLPPEENLKIAEDIGSDVPLFLLGGTVLGSGRGEEVFPLDDLPSCPCVIATPRIGVSTPQAFQAWDDAHARRRPSELTGASQSHTMNGFSRAIFSWLYGSSSLTGVSAKGGDRAEPLLLDLVRAGIENDFEQVVFPKYPELREVKRVLERAGASYASLSGSGAAVYGLFASRADAAKAAKAVQDSGVPAVATATLPRREYWKNMFA